MKTNNLSDIIKINEDLQLQLIGIQSEMAKEEAKFMARISAVIIIAIFSCGMLLWSFI